LCLFLISYTKTVPSYSPTAKSAAEVGWKSKHITPASQEYVISGLAVFFKEYLKNYDFSKIISNLQTNDSHSLFKEII